ncbi:hypothetical protein CRUP_023607 [Coryphaenoides rupestris]|nr:hypothetical protein CRUP_023607 [Coryphaenoides rupestris]
MVAGVGAGGGAWAGAGAGARGRGRGRGRGWLAGRGHHDLVLALAVGDDGAQHQGDDSHEVEVPLGAQELVQVHLGQELVHLRRDTHTEEERLREKEEREEETKGQEEEEGLRKGEEEERLSEEEETQGQEEERLRENEEEEDRLKDRKRRDPGTGAGRGGETQGKEETNSGRGEEEGETQRLCTHVLHGVDQAQLHRARNTGTWASGLASAAMSLNMAWALCCCSEASR